MSATVDLTHPSAIIARLGEIEADLALRQNQFEEVARQWYVAQREIGRKKAQALLGSSAKTVAAAKAEGELAAYDIEGAASEAEYESLKAVIRVLEQRAMIGMSLLKAQGRT
jgi:hypothetical protein